MWPFKKKNMKAEQLANVLHYCGLDAYNNYQGKGYNRDQWDDFRLQIANELLKRVTITDK